MNIEQLVMTAAGAAVCAGQAILDVYNTPDFQVETKADQSPLTEADTRSHRLIATRLEKTGIPVLSEEGKDIPFEVRGGWRRLWIVDPLDGTKEFVKRLGEFTVNIALVEEGRPRMGVIYAPLKAVLYFGAPEIGAYRIAEGGAVGLLAGDRGSDGPRAALESLAPHGRRLPLDTAVHRPFVIVGSRSHATPELHANVEQKRRELGEVEFVSAGSSIKYCLVAEGKADLYPRLGPTMEWDTAAGQAIAEAAGASVTRYDDNLPMVYNKPDLLNPWHVARRKPVD
jgi:3'(2'), 5'-bisphosphate nucleotidase